MKNTNLKPKRTGRRKVRKESLSKSYLLYDTCDKCPLEVYIELVCSDNLQVLVVEGTPPIEVLKEARINLMTEFTDLSGSGQMNSWLSSQKRYYLYRNNIYALSVAYECIKIGLYEGVVDGVARYGVRFNGELSTPEQADRLLKSIEARIKLNTVQLDESIRQIESRATTENDKPITTSYFHDQLAVMSVHFKFDISSSITLAKYASYLKIYREAMESYSKSKMIKR